MLDGAALSRVVDTLLWLCEIPSPTGEERALSLAIEARLAGRVAPGSIRRVGDSFVVPISRGTGGPRVCLAGHLDVVRTAHDGPPRVEGDRVYGPGAADMKSGLAAMIELAESIRPEDLTVDLSLVFYAREEGPFADNELGPLLAAEPSLREQDFVVCLEPSDNHLQLGCNGSLHATVSFRGKTAHSSRPWQGENAIHKAAGFLAELGALAPRVHRDGDLEYRTVSSATMASGGRGRNVVPDLFELNLNHRFTPDTSVEAAKREVLGLVGGRAEVRFVDESPSAPTCRDHAEVERLQRAGVSVVEPKQAWTDVARFASAGVPAVNWGPGVNAQAHQRNEWTSVSLLEEGREILAAWATMPRILLFSGGRS